MDVLKQVFPETNSMDPVILEQLRRDSMYEDYIARQKRDVEAMKRDEAWEIPVDFDYGSLQGLSAEARGKLSRARPQTLGQASRIEGMTPAALTVLLAKLRRLERQSA